MTKEQFLKEVRCDVSVCHTSNLYTLNLSFLGIHDTIAPVQKDIIYDEDYIEEKKLEFYELIKEIHPLLIGGETLERYCQLSSSVKKIWEYKSYNGKRLISAIIKLKKLIESTKDIEVKIDEITPIYESSICKDIPSYYNASLMYYRDGEMFYSQILSIKEFDES